MADNQSDNSASAIGRAHLLVVVTSVAIVALAYSDLRAPVYSRAVGVLRLVDKADLAGYDAHVLATVDVEREHAKLRLRAILGRNQLLAPEPDIDVRRLVQASITGIDSHMSMLPSLWALQDLFMQVREPDEGSFVANYRHVVERLPPGTERVAVDFQFQYEDQNRAEVLRLIAQRGTNSTSKRASAPVTFGERRVSMLQRKQ